jgi:hypothetical protein
MTNATNDPPRKAEKIYPAAIAAAVFVLLFGPDGIGILRLLFVVPCVILVLIWMFFQFIYAIFHAEARKSCALRIGIWIFAVALVFGINVFRDRSIRQQADGIVAKIEDYRARHKTCPPDLEAIGENRESLRDKLGHSGYRCEKDRPRFWYAESFSGGFGRHEYDFEQKTWRLLPD